MASSYNGLGVKRQENISASYIYSGGGGIV